MKNLVHHLRALAIRMNCMPPLLARITIGIVFVESGWGKLHDIPKVISYFADLGIPFPDAQAHLVAVTEFAAGGLVLLGLLTRLASLPLIATMAVAIVKAKLSEITSASDLFSFPEFLYIILLFYLVIDGPGLIALDSLTEAKLLTETPEQAQTKKPS